MKESFFLKNKHAVTFALIVLFFTIFAVASAMTYRPEVDEAMFANPAMNLAERGFLGTTVLETEKASLTGISKRTYWVMPLFLVQSALFFKVLGVGIVQLRLVSLFWGIILLVAWYLITLQLSRSKNTALFCMFLVACSYMVIVTASMGRMDIMSASLGFSAMAAFLVLREKNFSQAILVSQTFIMLSGLSHTNGIMAFIGTAFLTIYFDREKIKLKHFFLAAVPYLIGGIAYGSYILQDIEAYRDQFLVNAKMGGRLSGFSSPFEGFTREFTERYPKAFGLGATTGGHSGPIYLKSLILIGYIFGVLGILLTKELRQNKNYFALLVLIGIYFGIFSVIDGQKQTYYLVHIIPLYVACLAIWAHWIWKNKSFTAKIAVFLGISAFICLQIGGIWLRIKADTYSKTFVPTIEYLKQNAKNDDLIMGKSDIGLGLDFPENFVADGSFGYFTGKRPKYIIYDSQVESSWADTKDRFPEYYEYLPRLLSEEYRIAYENEGFKVYVRRE